MLIAVVAVHELPPYAYRHAYMHLLHQPVWCPVTNAQGAGRMPATARLMNERSLVRSPIRN